MNKAVFLDRDGVINKNVFNPGTQEYESPYSPDDLEIYEWTFDSLKKLVKAGYMLFLVSNQPSFAKGKTSMENIKSIERKLASELEENGIFFKEFYYCYHHPEGIVKDLKKICDCRKPKPYFLLKAKSEYEIDFDNSWMVGDRDTDIQCGQRAGVRTILIRDEHSGKYQGKSEPELIADNLKAAAEMILNEGEKI
jgi:D-glycero-D-manno-heptose 1,7-bisphosphate phosphatase